MKILSKHLLPAHKIQRRLFLNLWPAAIILFVLFTAGFVSAAEIVSIQSISIQPYNDALDGFRSACGCKVRQLVLNEMYDENIKNYINKPKPDLILAVGMKALESIKHIRDIPVVYLMVLDPQSVISGNDNASGIDMYISPETQLSAIKKTVPHIKTVGLIYDPSYSERFAKDAAKASRSTGINIIAKKISRTKDFPRMLSDMKDEIDALWMVPDPTVITPEVIEYSFLFSIENNIPLIAFSKKYLEAGALVSLDIDPNDIGRQAWELADRMLSGTDMKQIKNTYARKLDVSINLKTARNFGVIPVNNMLIKAVAAK